MSFGLLQRLRRNANIAYSGHPVARLRRFWRYCSDDSVGSANVLLLPLTMLALTVLLVTTVPGASDAVAATCHGLHALP